jgi:hypothetical protein
MTNLRHNKMQPYYVENVNDVVPLVESLLSEGDVIGVGGSETLKQTGVFKQVAWLFWDGVTGYFYDSDLAYDDDNAWKGMTPVIPQSVLDRAKESAPSCFE